jgi:CPA1 family monovalent cation:H+ antiporter
MHYMVHWSWQASVLFGVLISATDPVAVLAMFKEWHVAPRLKLLIESESLVNDGSVAVLFAVAFGAVSGVAPTTGSVLLSFAQNLFGGIACGAAVGFGILFLAGTAEDPFVEITFTTVAAFGSFLLAQHLGCSGIMSTLTAGIIIGNLEAWNSFTSRGRTAVDSFWQYAAFVVNSLIFMLIGIRISKEPIGSHLIVAGYAILATLVARILGVVGCVLPFIKSKWKVTGAQQTILVWGGMRGALALALALSLPENLPEKAEVTAAAFAVVAFSILVQGMTLSPLISKLKGAEAT